MGDIFNNLLMGFQTVGTVQSILWILIGVCVGILGGAIPGISPSMAVALLLPDKLNALIELLRQQSAAAAVESAGPLLTAP